jgi:superfamily II DNA or RNA helicase
LPKTALHYKSGTIVIKGEISHAIPFATMDPRTTTGDDTALRAPAIYYSNIIEYLKNSRIDYQDFVLNADTLIPVPASLEISDKVGLSLRDYQQKAVGNWIKAGMRGSIVLPTGAGKTIVALKAIEHVKSSTLVIVPTLDLMDQWTAVLSKHFPDVKIGNLGGGADDLAPITVATYDSAYLRAPYLGNKFAFVIFDEVHHLAAPGYRSIAEQMAAPFRLGLTATIEREDDLHKDLPRLVGGGLVFQAAPEELAENNHLAPYEIERRSVEMLPEESEKYHEHYGRYQKCLGELGPHMRYAPFQKLVMMSTKNKTAREALLARNAAMEIALNSKSKIDELQEILAENRGTSKTIIFTQHNSLVQTISDRFFIPFITYKTSKDERQDVLQGFREGRYRCIVTSKVLDEGVDVPDAELGIILSGTGSAREFIQRLGRLLRPRPETNKKAKLIEIISAQTREVGTSAKRKRALKPKGSESGDDGHYHYHKDDDNNVNDNDGDDNNAGGLF